MPETAATTSGNVVVVLLFSDGASFHYYEAFPVKLLHTFQDYSGESHGTGVDLRSISIPVCSV